MALVATFLSPLPLSGDCAELAMLRPLTESTPREAERRRAN